MRRLVQDWAGKGRECASGAVRAHARTAFLLGALLSSGCGVFESSGLPLVDKGMPRADARADIIQERGIDGRPKQDSMKSDLSARDFSNKDTVPDYAKKDLPPDSASDAGPLCKGVFSTSVTGKDFYYNTEGQVGGYAFKYIALTSGTVTFDIRCASDASPVALGTVFTVSVETPVPVPSDGKRIRFTPTSKSSSKVVADVIVENQ